MTEELGQSASAASTPDTTERGRVAVLDQLLWKQLGDSATLASFTQVWLSLQCHMLEQARRGIVLLRTGDDIACSPVARWPEDQQATPELSAAAELAIDQPCADTVMAAAPVQA